MHLAIIGDNRPRLYWAMPPRGHWGSRSRCTRTRRPRSLCSTTRLSLTEDREQTTRYPAAKPRVRPCNSLRRSGACALRVCRASSPARNRPRIDRAHRILRRRSGQGPTGRVSICKTWGRPASQGRMPDARGFHRRGGKRFDRSSPDDILAYLPMAWVGDHLFHRSGWSRVSRSTVRNRGHGDDRSAQ